jgi:hypothetical protein
MLTTCRMHPPVLAVNVCFDLLTLLVRITRVALTRTQTLTLTVRNFLILVRNV